jgi:bile acid:Na+ symporter, BASS family
MKPWPIARLALFTILIPLGLGMAARQLAPGSADRIARPLAMFAGLLMVAAVLPILFAAKSAIWALVGNGTLLAIAAFVVVGLAVGHWLGGPDPRERTALALATAARHPAMALTIATTNFPDQPAVAPAILIYLIFGTVIAIPYLKWRERVASSVPSAI